MQSVENFSKHGSTSAPPAEASIGGLISSARNWAHSLARLVKLECKKAGIGIALMVGLGTCAGLLLFTGWLAMVGTLVAAAVENDILGWAWALFVAALVNFAGAAILVYLAIRRSRDVQFSATRRQLGLNTVAPGHHAQNSDGN